MSKKMFGFAAVAVGFLACGGAERAEARNYDSSAGTPAAHAGPSGNGSSAGASKSTSTGPQLSELDTKRAIAEINADLPEHKAKLKEICGADIGIEIDWNSFGRDRNALARLRGNWGVQLLVDSFRGVCRDPIGKDAVKSKIKSVKMINVDDKSKVKAAVAGGVFTAELTWGGTTPEMNANDLGAAITKGL